MRKKPKPFLILFVLLILIFGGPYLWRRYRDNDIKEHSEYAFAKIVKQTGSLINGHHWHYDFYFKDKLYQGHWPTNIDYNVQIGDYFIVNFSTKEPEHNKILYNYKLIQYDPNVVYKTWDTIPLSIVESVK
jgi:hypothetical protein